jgi:hypothetical protein
MACIAMYQPARCVPATIAPDLGIPIPGGTPIQAAPIQGSLAMPLPVAGSCPLGTRFVPGTHNVCDPAGVFTCSADLPDRCVPDLDPPELDPHSRMGPTPVPASPWIVFAIIGAVGYLLGKG